MIFYSLYNMMLILLGFNMQKFSPFCFIIYNFFHIFLKNSMSMQVQQKLTVSHEVVACVTLKGYT